MVMDTLAGLAFSYEVPRIEYMEELPKKKDESIINKYMLNEIIVGGLYVSIICLVFLKSKIIKDFYLNNDTMMTAFFSLFIFLAVFNAFNARTHRLNIFAHLKDNKVFLFIIIFIIVIQVSIIYSNISIFRTVPISGKEFTVMFLFSLTIIPLDFIRKIILKKKEDNRGV